MVLLYYWQAMKLTRQSHKIVISHSSRTPQNDQFQILCSTSFIEELIGSHWLPPSLVICWLHSRLDSTPMHRQKWSKLAGGRTLRIQLTDSTIIQKATSWWIENFGLILESDPLRYVKYNSILISAESFTNTVWLTSIQWTFVNERLKYQLVGKV